MPDLTVATTAQQVTDDALRALQADQHVIIRAHAGAGKTGGRSSGTVRMAGALARTGARVAVLTAQNDQVTDTVDRLCRIWPDVTTTFLPATSSFNDMPDWIRLRRQRPANLQVATSGTPERRQVQSGAGLFVMTASKFSFLYPAGYTGTVSDKLLEVEPFDVTIVDEAWMAPAALWPRLDALSRLLALIGDPGQILPWLPDTEFYPGMLGSPVESLPELVAREHAGSVTTFELAVSRRNASHTTALTGTLPAYAASPTRAMLAAHEVPLTLGAVPLQRQSVDGALARVAAHGVALDRLPAGIAPQDDPLVAHACALAADRLLQLGAELGHPDGVRQLRPEGITIVVAHHDQKAAVQRALADLGRRGSNAPAVATFNTIQGATTDVAIVWHPLSGRSDVSAFHADAGRLTVGLTRHTHGCLLISRDGVGDRLASAPVCDDLEGDARDGRYTGLLAHRRVWDAL
jgi:hypothetical protein